MPLISGNTEIFKVTPTLLEEKKIRNAQQCFALELLGGVLERIRPESCLQPLLKDWDLKRIGRMERAILRLGAFEILYTKTKPAVVINEAIELAKAYGEDNAPRLVNAVLDHLAKHAR